MALLTSSQVTLMQWSGHWYVSYLPLHISFHEFLPEGTDIFLENILPHVYALCFYCQDP